MNDLKVRIVSLEPMRIASVRVVSESPENDAWEKMLDWAEPLGLLDDIEKHSVFGFNNPSPSPGKEKYGYEFWIQIDPDTEPDGDIQLKEFEGGRYTVATCKKLSDIGDTWMKLWEWIKTSEYTWRKTHELEKPHNPLAPVEDLVLDLYLPIED